jgi:hypothetical protein
MSKLLSLIGRQQFSESADPKAKASYVSMERAKAFHVLLHRFS